MAALIVENLPLMRRKARREKVEKDLIVKVINGYKCVGGLACVKRLARMPSFGAGLVLDHCGEKIMTLVGVGCRQSNPYIIEE